MSLVMCPNCGTGMEFPARCPRCGNAPVLIREHGKGHTEEESSRGRSLPRPLLAGGIRIHAPRGPSQPTLLPYDRGPRMCTDGSFIAKHVERV